MEVIEIEQIENANNVTENNLKSLVKKLIKGEISTISISTVGSIEINSPEAGYMSIISSDIETVTSEINGPVSIEILLSNYKNKEEREWAKIISKDWVLVHTESSI